MVAKADRISRDLEYFYYSKFVLKNRGIELLSANSAEDFTSLGALAPIMEAMVVAFSQFERTRINDRMTAGRMLKAAAGGYSGGQPPYGYRPNGRHGLEPSDEYNALRLMRAMKEAGRTLQAICDALTAHGYKPRRGIVWRPSTVAGILNNKFYDDIYTYAGISAPRANPG